MSKVEKFLVKLLRGTSETNIDFDELCKLLEKLGFDKRIKGSHNIFTKDDVSEILNLQPMGSKAKTYQVKQVLAVIVKYGLGGTSDE
jgi:predicted RNA binding protein YcfA (HicA-like mRNA interferase family)